MLANNGSPQRARWAVMWIAVKGTRKKLIRKDFGDDLASAQELYLKVVKADKPYATLACVNMGFPPPEELRPHTVMKRGRIKGTRKVRTVEVNVQPLKELNLKGELWCPYCRRLIQFVLSKQFKIHGVMVDDPRYVCPICKVSHRDHNVRIWNPTATMHMQAALAPRTRTQRKPVSTRRKTRT